MTASSRKYNETNETNQIDERNENEIQDSPQQEEDTLISNKETADVNEETIQKQDDSKIA